MFVCGGFVGVARIGVGEPQLMYGRYGRGGLGVGRPDFIVACATQGGGLAVTG